MTTVVAKELAIVLKLIKHNTTNDSATRHGITAEYQQIKSATPDTELSLLTVIVCFGFMQDHKHSYSPSLVEKLHAELMREIIVDGGDQVTVFDAMLRELSTKYRNNDFEKYFNALYLMHKNITMVDYADQTLLVMIKSSMFAGLRYFLSYATTESIVFTDLAGNFGTALQELALKIDDDCWEFVEEYGEENLTLEQLLAIRRIFSYAVSYHRPVQDPEGRNVQNVRDKFAEFHKLTIEQPQLIEAAINRKLLSVPFIIDYFSAQRAEWLFSHGATINIFINILDKIEAYADNVGYQKGDYIVLQQLPHLFARWTSAIDFDLLTTEDAQLFKIAFNRVPIILLKISILPSAKKENIDDFHMQFLTSLIELTDTKFFEPSFRDERGQSMLHAVLNFMTEMQERPDAIEFARHLLNELYAKGVDISLPASIDQAEESHVGTIFAIVMATDLFNDPLQYMYDVLGTQQCLSQEQAMAILQDVLPGILLQPNFPAMQSLITSSVIPLVYNGFDVSKLDTNNLLNFVDILVGFIRNGENSNQILSRFFAYPKLWQGVESCAQTLLLLRRYQLPLSSVLQKLREVDSYEHLRAVCCLILCKSTSVVEIDYNVFHYLAANRELCADLEEIDYLQELIESRALFNEDCFPSNAVPNAMIAEVSMQESFYEDHEKLNFYASNNQVLQSIYSDTPTRCAFVKAADCDNEIFFLLFLSTFEGHLLHRNVPLIGIFNWDPEVVNLDRLVKARITTLVVDMFRRGIGMNNIINHLEDKTRGLNSASYWGFDNQLLKELNHKVEMRRGAFLYSSRLTSAASTAAVVPTVHEDHFKLRATEESSRSPSPTH